jgi:hypothetical protein
MQPDQDRVGFIVGLEGKRYNGREPTVDPGADVSSLFGQWQSWVDNSSFAGTHPDDGVAPQADLERHPTDV